MSDAMVSVLRLLFRPPMSPSLVLSYKPAKGFEAWCPWPQGTLSSLAGDAHAALRRSCPPPPAAELLKHWAQGQMGGSRDAGLALASWLLWYDARRPKTILEL